MSENLPFPKLRESLRSGLPGILKHKNVVGIGIGYKVQGGKRVDTPCLVVSVTKKEPRHLLDELDIVPQMIGEAITDVIETGEIVAFGLNRQELLRPARPGMSIGHAGGGTGTLGAVVKRGEQRYILSNNHVLAVMNRAKKGDPILQPAPGDGGTAADQIGVLEEYIPLILTDMAASSEEAQAEPAGCGAMIASLLSGAKSINQVRTAMPVPLTTPANRVDAALALPGHGSMLDASIVDVGTPPKGVTKAELGMRIVKSGRTTGLTQGTILQVDATLNIKYGDKIAQFEDQIITSPFSDHGDSGSLVMDAERNAVGLLFSGSEHVSIISPIEAVLSALNVEMVLEGDAQIAREPDPPPELG